VLKRLLAVTVIAGLASGIGAAVAAGADQSRIPTPAAVPTTSTTVLQATAQGLTQTISVSVRGGSLSVRPASVVVPLMWDAGRGRYRGTANVDIVDARGTLTGWTASAVIQSASGPVSVRPGEPVALTGEDSGLSAGKKAQARGGDVVTLGSAASGGGGGSYRIPVELELSGRRTSDGVTVTLLPQVTGA
jgi:hypothetical protein